MTKNDSRLPALLSLMDDPDAEVYDAVCTSILAYGKAAIPGLEALWEHSADSLLQDRIETLIHRVHFTGRIASAYLFRDRRHITVVRLPAEILVIARNRKAAATEIIAPLLADRFNLELNPGQILHELLRPAIHVRIERSRQAPVR